MTKMYYYTLSSGSYSDYSFKILIHREKFSRQEFINMYNSAIDVCGRTDNEEKVAEVMCELFGFTILNDELEINCGYGYFGKITNDEDIFGDHKVIFVDG